MTLSLRSLRSLRLSDFYLLDKYPEDARIVRYLGGMLDDKRVVPEKPVNDPNPDPVQEHFGGMPVRLCDCAYGTIGRILIARKDLPKQGLGVGDPGGEYTYEGRDRQIAAMKKKLKELGLWEEPAKPAVVPSPGGQTNGAATQENQPDKSGPGETSASGSSARALPWGWIAAAGAAGVALLTWLMLRRKG